jgi:sigma-B regulation protein RsbU (phosphoserine phosphatase)
MQESDGTAARTTRIIGQEKTTMAEVAEPYLREQLEKRRNELKSAISSPAPAMPVAPLLDLLSEVDSAMQRMEQGTYGICEVCHDPVEKDRLLADPLTRLCIDHLTHEEQRALERDVELASSIQRGLLPQSDVRFRDWQIHYLYNPAGIVSGDYCDVILPATNDGKLFFLVGDVAGKGIGASLLMTHLHAMFRSLSGGGHDLEKLLEIANSVFCESTTASQYATLICGRAGRSGELEIVNAGHLPALVITKEGVEQFGSTGLPLGLFKTSSYTVTHVRLEPGDSLLLYTDGISETRSPTDKEYGSEGLARVAGERYGWPPHEIAAACIQDVKNYSANARQTDDQTLMVVHRADLAGSSLSD